MKDDKPSSMKRAVSTLPNRPIREEVADNGGEKVDERGMKRQTLYLPPGVYEAIRDVAYAQRVSKQEILRRAISLYLSREAGIGTWEELDDRPENLRSRGGE